MISSTDIPQADSFVQLDKVTHIYGHGEREVRALDETTLRIEKGDFIALVGPSGCGKSTILKLVTGLINASSGYLFVSGREIGAEPWSAPLVQALPPEAQIWLISRLNRIISDLSVLGMATFSTVYKLQPKGSPLKAMPGMCCRSCSAIYCFNPDI